jgi:hypothetical protein
MLNESAVSGAIAIQGMCQTPSLYQNETSLHQMNKQALQLIQPISMSNANANTNHILHILLQNIPSCSNQDDDSAETASAGTAMNISAKVNKRLKSTRMANSKL